MAATIRTRYAPSPTGPLHIGGARTALFNYLFAKQCHGQFIVRIEDTDLERSDRKYEEEILDSSRWLGIVADESPKVGGPYGPYRQSERIASYQPHLERLIASGQAYRCPHTEAELETEKGALMAAGRNPVHTCAYRDGGAAPAPGSTIIRFKTPAGRTLTFTDRIRGEIAFQSDLLGDFSIARNLSSPLYNFAVTIDDHETKISHVIRGEDHIPNTPKQMLIWEALWPGKPLPEYAHMPLILGPDRAKLSKRHGATAIREFREQGYLPEALVNCMALLGWNPGGDRELFSMAELVAHFDLGRVQKAGAVFNLEKLKWMNAAYIRRASEAELTPIVQEMGYLSGFTVRDIAATLKVERTRLQVLSELSDPEKRYMRHPLAYGAALLRWKSMSHDEIQDSLNASRAIIESLPDGELDELQLAERFLREIGGGDKGVLLWPLRVALTGLKESPGPFAIMAVLGKGESIRRIQNAFKVLASANIPA